MTERRIYKYPLEIVTGVATVEMPYYSHVLCVQVQRELPCVWATVDPRWPLRTHKFHVFGTGHAFPEFNPGLYLGTIQLHGGDLVAHVFHEAPL